MADFHYDHAERGGLVDVFATASREADVLALCGDLTTHGRPEQMQAFVEELKGVDVPIVAVLGNHDHEEDRADELAAILRERGVHVLDGEHVVVEGVGFAGLKGFAGGFGREALAPFGEKLIKDFVHAALEEALRLEMALRSLETETRVVLLHYAPVIETLRGEPETIYPFLGSSRLVQPIDTHGATVVFHGHAHHGTLEGKTPGGVPVYNVAMPLLRTARGESYRTWTVRAPERRRATA